MSVDRLWRKSFRAFATRNWILATRRMALRRLADPRRLRLRLRWARRGDRNALLAWLTGAMVVPFDNAANTATPRSMPTDGSPLAVGSAPSRCH